MVFNLGATSYWLLNSQETVILKRKGIGKIENKFHLPDIGQVVPEMYAFDDIPGIPVLKYTYNEKV